MNPNIAQFYGVGGAPLIESCVEYLKKQWRLPAQMAPLASLLISIIWNLFLGAYVLQLSDIRMVVVSGIMTALAASGWHELTSN